MEKVRAKFQVVSVKEFSHGGKQVEMNPVFTGNPEDNQFAKATPSGNLTMFIDNPPAADFFIPGKKYYLNFTPETETAG